MYVRKTEDEYHLVWDYGYGDGPETICVCATAVEAKQDRRAYLENEGIFPKIVKRRVPKRNCGA